MILILSGAYVGPELVAEVGLLPPSFLPMGNKRLFEFQVKALRSCFPDDEIIISIPEFFTVDPYDQELLDRVGVGVVRSSGGIGLGESLLRILERITAEKVLRLLHGDTPVGCVPLNADLVLISRSFDDYMWEQEPFGEEDGLMWCGYFSFSNPLLLRDLLIQMKGDFVAAVRGYIRRIGVAFIEAADWMDLGHVNTYFRSRSAITTQRVFNSLSISQGVLTKSSSDEKKMAAEWNWYASLPPGLKVYAPMAIQKGQRGPGAQAFYQLEYLPHLPLNELFVHARRSFGFWRHVLKKVREIVTDFANCSNLSVIETEKARQNYLSLVFAKTKRRLSSVVDNFNLDPSEELVYNGRTLPCLSDIVIQCQREAETLRGASGFVHGDLCFSNILYNSRSDALKLVDPRGVDADGNYCVYGCYAYDLAKLTHSVIGMYDQIIAGRFLVSENQCVDWSLKVFCDPVVEQVQKWYLEEFECLGINSRRTLGLAVLLFLSMIPLHGECPLRQKALFANALRLFVIANDKNNDSDTNGGAE